MLNRIYYVEPSIAREVIPPIAAAMAAKGTGAPPAPMPAMEVYAAADGPGVAVIPVYGGLWPEKYASIRRQFDSAMGRADVGGIVLDIDSGGGSAAGCPELARHIRESRGTKPIISVAATMAASAAYYIGVQADRMYGSTSGDIGSVGVISMHIDASKMLEDMGWNITLITAGRYKAEGNPFEPLGDEAREHFQERVNDCYSMFVDDVAAARGINRRVVLSEFGEGRCFSPAEAARRGMIDRVAGVDFAIAELMGGNRGSRKRRAELDRMRRESEIACLRSGCEMG